jgi:endonuclease YncB( thermonuclease family)
MHWHVKCILLNIFLYSIHMIRLTGFLLAGVFAGSSALPPLALAGERIPGPYVANVVEALDGDSFRAEIAIWPGQRARAIVRIRGVDSAEMRARCPAEQRLALTAREYLARRLAETPVTIANIGGGKYFGRVLADVRFADGADAASVLLDRGLARPYRGGKRAGWCDGGSSPGGGPPD